MHGQQNTFSDLFYTIAERIACHTNWILGENLTEMLDLINDEGHKQIITIDNIFTVQLILFRNWNSFA